MFALVQCCLWLFSRYLPLICFIMPVNHNALNGERMKIIYCGEKKKMFNYRDNGYFYDNVSHLLFSLFFWWINEG